MNYFIPNDHIVKLDKKSIFVLTRPFYNNGVWVKKGNKFDEWELDINKTSLVEKVENADVLLIPYPINYYFENGHIGLLEKWPNAIVTLHGWLRIVPPYVCERSKIYNGHPGLITKYPELKGKDPQEKAFKLKHKTIGCVLHKVSAGVDEGKIVMEERTNAFRPDSYSYMYR